MAHEISSADSNASVQLDNEPDSEFLPELDRPYEREAAPAEAGTAKPERARGADGKFLADSESTATQSQFTHSRAVSRLAHDLGYTQEEINQTPPSVLEDRVYHVNRRTLEMLAAQRQATGSGMREAPQSAVPVSPPEPEAEPDLSFLDDGLRKFLETQKKEIASLKAELHGQRQARETESRDDTIDRVFEQINDPDLFGSGTRKQLASGSDEMERRKAVVTLANTLTQGSLEQRLQQAHKRLFGRGASRSSSGEGNSYDEAPRDQNGQRVPASLQRRRDEWDDGALARPSHRKPGPLSPDKRAALAAHKYLTEHDLSDGLDNLDEAP